MIPSSTPWATSTAAAGRSPSLRWVPFMRLKLGDDYFVHRWGRGVMGSADWINTGEKAPDPDVYQSFHSPAHGEQTDQVRVSRAVSRLSVDLGWDGTYQKATARFHATLSFWEAVTWLSEKYRLAYDSIPKVTGR